MNSTVLVVIIVACIAGVVYLVVKRKGSAAVVSGVENAVSNAATDIKSHVTSTVEKAATDIKTRTATVGTVIVDKITGAKTPSAPVTAEPAPVAPVIPSVADAPPPVSVAVPLSPVQPAAGGGGTELSNGGKANPPQPTRSPAGYPLEYALGANNEPIGAARVLYGGQTFANDAEVAAYVSAVATGHAAQDAAAAAAAAYVYSGPVPVASLGVDDLRFLWWATMNAATPKMHNWEYAVLSGSRAAIQQAMNSVGNNLHWEAGYAPTQYAGVLRSYYDAAVKV